MNTLTELSIQDTELISKGSKQIQKRIKIEKKVDGGITLYRAFIETDSVMDVLFNYRLGQENKFFDQPAQALDYLLEYYRKEFGKLDQAI